MCAIYQFKTRSSARTILGEFGANRTGSEANSNSGVFMSHLTSLVQGMNLGILLSPGKVLYCESKRNNAEAVSRESNGLVVWVGERLTPKGLSQHTSPPPLLMLPACLQCSATYRTAAAAVPNNVDSAALRTAADTHTHTGSNYIANRCANTFVHLQGT